MKKIFILSLTILCFISCEKDKKTQSVSEIVEAVIPTTYQNNQDIFFVNASGTTKKFDTFYEDKTYESGIVGGGTIRLFSTIIVEQDAIDPLIYISASNNVGSDLNNIEDYSLRVHLNPNNVHTDDWLKLTLPFKNGELTQLVIHEFNPTLSFDFVEHTFSDVYSDTFDYPSYSEVYYNKEVGVVAFRDHLDDLWVYSHFE